MEEDAKLAFLDRDGDLLADRTPQFDSLPVLLESRRHTLSSTTNNSRRRRTLWQSKMLFNFTKKPNHCSVGRRQWRPYAHRNIPFTRLGTPAADAVLAMDRTGSSVLSLGTKDDTDHASPGLALRFYGISSPAAASMVQYQQRRTRCVGQSEKDPSARNGRSMAPLLQCVPLLHGLGNLAAQQPQSLHGGVSADQGESTAAENAIYRFQGNVSPVSTPVTILISKDWRLGVAMVRRRVFNDTTGESQAETTGTMVMFTMTRQSYETLKVYTCPNVEMGSALQDRCVQNLMWQVQAVPYFRSRSNQDGSRDVLQYACVPGYVVMNDEGDGFRFTWCTADSFFDDETCRVSSVPSSSPLERPVAPTHSILTRHHTWEVSFCDSKSGNRLPLSATAKSQEQLSIVYEAYLHIDVLLADILSKRKGFVDEHPDFFFSLVSLHNVGRLANLVIAFARTKKSCSIGVFVNIDLFTGCYEELDWVKEASTDPTAVKKWCDRLAINRRMKHVQAGPYSVTDKSTVDWSCIVKDTKTIDYDKDDDFNEVVWRDFVEGKGPRNSLHRQVPKFVTLSSLYPDCDVISNEALLKCEPVKSMRARDAPIQLLYG